MVMRRPTIGPLIFVTVAVVLGAYFAFAAVQGRYGILSRVQIEAEIDAKRAEWQEYIAAVHPWELDRYLTSM